MTAGEFAHGIKARLKDGERVRHRLSVISKAFGRKKLTRTFLQDLESHLARAGVHTHARLTDPATLRSDTIRFSLQPFAPAEIEFGCERQLVALVQDAIGVAEPLKGLTLRAAEYRLPSSRRIDLLCEERDRGGRGALVALELKRGRADGGAVEQIDEYLEELATQPIARGRNVRGILLAKGFRDVTLLLASKARRPIRCYCYNMGFQPATLTSADTTTARNELTA